MAKLSLQGQGSIIKGTVAVDLASVATLATTEKEVVVADAVLGDTVIVNPPAAGLTAGMCVCDARVSEAGKIKIRVFNGSAGTVDEASGTWEYILIRS
jgi:hypothetical protein